MLFKNECLRKSKNNDSYYKALFYTPDIDDDIRHNIKGLFNFDKDVIKCIGLIKRWQRSRSYKVCLFEFNMWNGFVKSKETTLYELFDCEYARYFQEVIKIKHPLYFKQKNKGSMLL